MNTRETLECARDTLKKGFCQGYLAKTKEGYPISPTAKDAACWCAVGAIMKCVGSCYSPEVAETVERVMPWDDLVEFNNTHTQDEVVALFDATIERMEK